MKIYTRTGDNGSTSLAGGSRVEKDDPRIEAYGTLDELSAHLGYLHDTIDSPQIQEQLEWVLDRLMVCGSWLAAEASVFGKLPRLDPDDVARIERMTDGLLENLPQLRYFTLPCGNPTLSYTHICRTVCRRAERRILTAAREYEFPALVRAFANRLSDYLYALGRRLGTDAGAREILWEPKK